MQPLKRRGLDALMRMSRKLYRENQYPASARHVDCTLMLSEDHPDALLSSRLFDLALASIRRASAISMSEVSRRMGPGFAAPYPSIWPGEHYKLLAGLVQELQPGLVVEVGTGEGLSALAMLPHIPPHGRIVSFDILPWSESRRTCLRATDFASGQLTQTIDDLSDGDAFERHRDLLGNADLVFVDGPKDCHFEQLFVHRCGTLRCATGPVFLFDDIRQWNMLDFWRGLSWPKLDITSFGHWTGTGLAEWVPARSAETA